MTEIDMPAGVEEIRDAQYFRIPLELIEANPYQPRQFFDRRALEALGESIRKIGQLEDILVRPHNGKFQIVLGERRWRAHQLAGLPAINAKVRELDDDQAYTISLTENVQREELTGVEEAFAFKSYLDRGMTQDEVGDHFGKLDDRIGEKLKLLSSSYYVRYLEAKTAGLDAELKQIRHDNELLRGIGGARREVRIVGESGLSELLGADWELVASLSGDRFILRGPAAGSDEA